MKPQSACSTIYFDGSCPLCRAEIQHYRGLDDDGALDFVDVSQAGASLPPGLVPKTAMARFHVRAADGRLLSGAAGFVEVWSRLPRWRWLAKVAATPGVLTLLEAAYKAFLPARPYLSRLFGRLTRGARA